MQNSIILEIAAGIITFIGIVLFVGYQVVHFNNHLKDNVHAH